MEHLAVIHAGPAAANLKTLVRVLDSVGVSEDYFMTDLIETLKYKEDFQLALMEMTTELTFGQYMHLQLSNRLTEVVSSQGKDLVSELLQITSDVTSKVAKYLHSTLVTQGRYDENGKFLYEYRGFDGKLIYLRHL